MPSVAAAILTLALLQDGGIVPEEAKGLRVFWIPRATAELTKIAPGFKFRHPAEGPDRILATAKEFAAVLDKLPAEMKRNGIWVSTSNDFLYSEAEAREFKALAALARSRRIYLFRSEIAQQPQGWKRVED